MVGVQAIRKHEKYLDLPSLIGRAKLQTFEGIKESVEEDSRVEGEIVV